MMGNYNCPATLEPLAQADLGLTSSSWLEQVMEPSEIDTHAVLARVIVTGSDEAVAQHLDELAKTLPGWQLQQEKDSNRDVSLLTIESGPVIIARCLRKDKDAQGMLQQDSDYARGRNVMGQVFPLLKQLKPGTIELEFAACSRELAIGCLTGLELAAYDYRSSRDDTDKEAFLPTLNVDIKQSWLNEAIATGHAVNTARHLVNLPAAELNPQSYSELTGNLFRGSSMTHVTVWPRERLREEKMGLMTAVGAAAEHGPCLIHICYRHPDCDDAPIALVGKGITFDTGGLDLKPAAFMRNMKKDMGGSAALAGVAVWLDRTRPVMSVDIYLAVAENAVGTQAFRPGDILTARNGKTVEIDNTDAEGRLVLADALSVAVTRDAPEKPSVVIDVATLTGAARVALGMKVGVLFATSDELSADLVRAGENAGDPLWRLPMIKAYDPELRSPVAALVNSSTSRFGGAITAAMFLAEFVGDVPWAHIDVNAWTDANDGAISGPGGNGQMVQCLIDYLRAQI